MDDFVRNFLVRMGLTATLEKFETEWYELEATGRLNKEDMGVVPDVYNYNQELNEQCNALRAEVNAQKAVVAKATATWDKFRKERDLHRMHHKRIGQEKNKLLERERRHIRTLLDERLHLVQGSESFGDLTQSRGHSRSGHIDIVGRHAQLIGDGFNRSALENDHFKGLDRLLAHAGGSPKFLDGLPEDGPFQLLVPEFGDARLIGNLQQG